MTNYSVEFIFRRMRLIVFYSLCLSWYVAVCFSTNIICGNTCTTRATYSYWKTYQIKIRSCGQILWLILMNIPKHDKFHIVNQTSFTQLQLELYTSTVLHVQGLCASVFESCGILVLAPRRLQLYLNALNKRTMQGNTSPTSPATTPLTSLSTHLQFTTLRYSIGTAPPVAPL